MHLDIYNKDERDIFVVNISWICVLVVIFTQLICWFSFTLRCEWLRHFPPQITYFIKYTYLKQVGRFASLINNIYQGNQKTTHCNVDRAAHARGPRIPVLIDASVLITKRKFKQLLRHSPNVYLMCWPSVCDACPTSNWLCLNFSYLLEWLGNGWSRSLYWQSLRLKLIKLYINTDKWDYK